MKNLKAILLLCALASAAVTCVDDAAAGNSAAPGTDTLLFSNKDILRGTFLGCDKAGLRWQSAASKEPLLFQTGALGGVNLPPRTSPAAAAAATHTVLLANGDELPGAIVSLDDKSLVLDTWFAGRLTIPRAMVTAVTRAKNNSVIYQGPNALNEWTAGEEEPDDEGRTGKCWAFKNGVFTASSFGSIWRDMKLPARSDIGFDLTLPAGEPDLDMYIYCEGDGDEKDCYLFQFGLGGASLTRISKGQNVHMNGGNEMDEKAFRGEKVRINIRADKDAKKLWLLVNGKAAGEWTDPEGFAGTGTFLKFTSQIEQGALKMSNIKVTTWNPAPGETGGAIPGGAQKEDSLVMENQDRVTGKLKSIADGKVVFTSSYADVTIPLGRIVGINLPGDGTPPDSGEKKPGGVRAWLAGGGNATLEFESWDGRQVAVTSPAFGKAVFSPGAFQRLQFQAGPADVQDDSAVDTGDEASRENTAPTAAADTLRFANKDVLHGTLLGCSCAGVRWQSLAAKEPFLFQSASLADVTLAPRKLPEGAAQSTSLVQMANGDALPGDVVSLDDKSLMLDTWYAGRLAIPRDSVKDITFTMERRKILYQGPDGLDGWTFDLCNPEDEEGKPVKRKADWDYRNGTFISTGFDELKHALNLPARSSIEFDIDMQGAAFSDSTPHIEIWISDEKAGYILDVDDDTRTQPGRMQQISENHFTLRRFSPGHPAHMMDQEVDLEGSGLRREKVHVDLRFDREAKTISLFVNGKLARQWIDKEGFPALLTTLMFDTTDSEGSHTDFSNIRIAEWNGRMDAPRVAGPSKPGEDTLMMENGDSLSGKIKSVAGGKIILSSSSFPDMAIPFDHLTAINLASPGAAPKKAQAGDDFRATVAGGGSILLKVESWDEKKAAVSSPDFGKAVFSPDVFQRIQFDPGRQAPAIDDAAADAGGGDEDR